MATTLIFVAVQQQWTLSQHPCMHVCAEHAVHMIKRDFADIRWPLLLVVQNDNDLSVVRGAKLDTTIPNADHNPPLHCTTSEKRNLLGVGWSDHLDDRSDG